MFRSLFLVALCSLTALAAKDADITDRAGQFSAVAAKASLLVKRSYAAVESANYRRQVGALILHYDQNGFHPETITPFLTQEDVALRLNLLEALRKYAVTLGEITGKHYTEEVNDASVTFGKSLLALRDTSLSQSFLKSQKTSVSNDEVRGAAAGMATLGHFFQERHRRKELPQLIASMQDSVDGIVHLLISDLGHAPRSTAETGDGLRGQAYISFQALLRDEILFIDHGGLSPPERREEIAKLPALDLEQKTTDVALAHAQQVLEKLAVTHRALNSASQNGAGFGALLMELSAENDELSTVFDKLGAKK